MTTVLDPTRNFSLSYIILDSIFLVFFAVLLLVQKKKMTFLFSLAGGILYFLVDFLIFYLITRSRIIYINNVETNALNTALILFWMSVSYGFLDFAFIWLWLSKDKNALLYSAIIVIWWICCPLISEFINTFLDQVTAIKTTRTTNKYHGVMGILMVVGYFIIIIMNLTGKYEKIPVVRLFVIGFMAQFLWEFILFIFGIRFGDNNIVKIVNTILRDSLVETNLGMPYLYFIHKGLSKKFNEDLSKVKNA